MNDDEKMFHWGTGFAIFAIILTLSLQVLYRTQDKARANVRAQIVSVQKDIAAASANFSGLVRPEVLRNVVISVYPKSSVLGFNKSVNIDEIPIKSPQ